MFDQGLGESAVDPRDAAGRRRSIESSSRRNGCPIDRLASSNGRQDLTAEIPLGIERLDFGLRTVDRDPFQDRRLEESERGSQDDPQQVMASGR